MLSAKPCLHRLHLFLVRDLHSSSLHSPWLFIVDILPFLETISQIRKLREIHACMIVSGLVNDPFAASQLISSPALSDISYAFSMFRRIPEPNLFIWNTMIRKCHDPDDHFAIPSPLLLYKEMLQVGTRPNDHTFVYLLKSLTTQQQIREGEEVHTFVVKFGSAGSQFVSSVLVGFYVACGFLESGHRVFDEMLHHGLVLWTAIIRGYLCANRPKDAVRLFLDMQKEGLVPDAVALAVVISACGQMGVLDTAKGLHGFVIKSGVKFDPYINSGLLCMYGDCGHLDLALAAFSCAKVGALDMGIWVHAYAEKNFMNTDGSLDPALIDLYAKCGRVERAIQVFERVPREDLFSWTSIICGLAMHGHAKDALDFFSRMMEEGIQPDDVTLVGVLTACSHSGLREHGYQYFHSMEKVYNIIPKIEHYGCMVDLLGRLGHLREAYDLIMRMPMKPNSVIWGSLLSSCKVHKNVKFGEVAAERMLELEPDDLWVRIMLSNIYAEACLWDQVMKLRKEMKEKGMTKMPGCSTIEVDVVVHEFLVGDGVHDKNCCM
ncbi:hypothetical protein H6P81_010158 [Aristolochia fimbriata]|uniref:Pentatricopeptide repeat-containing protein n=1 Tax=Aristolochia fimbriata TaxID=158543 RepID=A0AAV7EN84_ARIFI|nr:hypothetical protein H6P81_010158 [Aristolochia fimbriata]